MKTVLGALIHCMETGRDCVLVSAVGGSGSVPRKTQAHMLVTPQGRLCGTVGGGASEGFAIELGKQLIARRSSCVREFELCESGTMNLGMICGGKVSMHFRFIDAGDGALLELFRHAASLIERGEKAWLIIRLDTNGFSLADAQRVYGEAVDAAILSGLDDQAGQRRAGGAVYYAEQLVSPGRVYIFGGGHVAQALVPALAAVDFRCVILEDREEFADPALFPMADEVMLIREEEWREKLRIIPEDRFCVMTRGHKNDLACQAYALETPACYIGVIGSRKKIAATNEKLRLLGFDDAAISRIVTPIGLLISAQTPAEIAVSIAAQLILHRATGRTSIP